MDIKKILEDVKDNNIDIDNSYGEIKRSTL